MSNRIIHPLSDFLSESRFSYAEIDANRDEIVTGMQQRLSQDFNCHMLLNQQGNCI